MTTTLSAVRAALSHAFLAGHGLRDEDERKAAQLVRLLEEIARLPMPSRTRGFVAVDACAGRSALGVLAAALLWKVRGHAFTLFAIEREPARRARVEEAAQRLDVAAHVHFLEADVANTASWPAEAGLVLSLHACGNASDLVIDACIATRARRLLLVPCCYGAGARHDSHAQEPPAQTMADRWAQVLPLPSHALVRRRFAQSLIEAERTLRLEAAGYQTEVLEAFPPTLSPFHLLWRAQRVQERVRSAKARHVHERLLLAPGETPKAP